MRVSVIQFCDGTLVIETGWRPFQKTFLEYDRALSRELAGAESTVLGDRGIFSDGKVTFFKRSLRGGIGAITAPLEFSSFSWRESTIDKVALEIRARVGRVKAAFLESKAKGVRFTV